MLLYFALALGTVGSPQLRAAVIWFRALDLPGAPRRALPCRWRYYAFVATRSGGHRA